MAQTVGSLPSLPSFDWESPSHTAIPHNSANTASTTKSKEPTYGKFSFQPIKPAAQLPQNGAKSPGSGIYGSIGQSPANQEAGANTGDSHQSPASSSHKLKSALILSSLAPYPAKKIPPIINTLDSDSPVKVPVSNEASTRTTSAISPAKEPTGDSQSPGTTYRSYLRRWFLVGSVVILNLANYSHWISYASVQSKAAWFYQVSQDDIQMIMTASYSMGIPFCCLATYVLAKRGLRTGLLVGAGLTFLGGLMCCLSTLPGLVELWPPRVPYWMTLAGQTITGMGSPFLAAVPTKISQHWFCESQRPLATTILSLSNPLGMVVGQSLTPVFVTSPNHIPIMNIVWFVPAFWGSLLLLITVTSSRPPTPPSPSAAMELDQKSQDFWVTIRSLVTNKAYLVLVVVIGGAMGYLSAQQIKNEPIMCSLGYTNDFSGLCAGLVFGSGIFGSIVLGLLFAKVSNIIKLTKILCMPLAGVMLTLVFVMQWPSVEAMFVVFYFLLGFLAIGLYPTMLELAVEATFPNDESVVMSIIIISSSIQGILVMQLDGWMSHDVENGAGGETCSQPSADSGSGSGFSPPRNHDTFVSFLNGFGIALLLLFFLGFHTKLHRTAANKQEQQRRQQQQQQQQQQEEAKPGEK